MAFSVPERNQVRGEHAAVVLRAAAPAPGVDAIASRAGAAARRPAGVRPSQVPATGEAAGLSRVPRPGGGAVQRAVQVRPGGAGARPPAARPSAISAQPVRDVLRGAGQPLAGPVREEMEARLGADFSDVRIHDDAAGHRAVQAVGARAFTAGSHIAFRRSQYDPVSAAGRLTLAHELTHVMQQRSGPVAGTDAVGGIRVSDPADSFERAAQASARRALAGGGHSAGHPVRTSESAGHPVTPAGDAVPVQRAVGFEFELQKGSSTVHTVETDGSLTLKTDSKEPLKYLNANGQLVNSGLAYISADNGRVEYVTEPLDTKTKVISAVSSIVKFHTTPAQGRRTDNFTGVDLADYKVRIDTGTGAKPQASLGVRLQDIPDLFEELRTLTEEEELGQKRRKKEDIELAGLNRRVGLLASERTVRAENLARRTVRNLPAPTDPAINQTERKKAIGLLAIIFKTALDADEHKGATLEDAKYAFSLMPRSDFISMFYLLRDETRDWIENDLIQAISATNGLGNGWLDDRVLGRYHGEIPIPLQNAPYIYQGPTRRAWLQSIINGQQGDKDDISPPPGYTRHNAPNHRPEGIGALATPANLSVFELRGILLGKSEDSVPVQSWLRLALVVTGLAARVTGDNQLA